MAPKDKYQIVFGILLLHGIGTLLPWNMLINAYSYFVDYKLNVTESSPALDNYKKNFLSYLGIASKAPNIALQIINMIVNSNYGSLSTRISVTLVIQALIFVITVILAVVDSYEWPEIFFWLTMISAFVINIANGVYQGCCYGSAAKLPMKYTNAVTIGMNLSGTIAALFMIAAIALSPSLKIEAVIFFSCAVVILTACLITEFYLKKNKFYIYYTEKEKEPELESIQHINLDSQNNLEKEIFGYKRYIYVFKKTWLQLLNIIIIYFVSLSIFPAIQANVKQVNNIIDENYFGAVFCFLSFNLFATIGNFIAQKIRRPGPKYLIIFSLLRILYIPFFLYCNYRPENTDRNMKVLINNDYVYIVGGITMALSAGYLSSLCMMYAPKCVQPSYSSTAGMMAALTIILGILAGINFSLVYPWIVTL